MAYHITCLVCSKEFKSKHETQKYCSNTCQHEFQHQEKIKSWLENGASIGTRPIKRYLKDTFGYVCSECGLTNWQNKDIVLELEHKDGDSENNKLENLCLICPNCHSQTSTYKAKNKGNGRHSRKLRYQEGKSY